MAGDAMGDVIGDIGAVIFLTVRRALLSAPGGAPRPPGAIAILFQSSRS